MPKSQISLSEWKFDELRSINEPSDPQLAIEELRTLIKGTDKYNPIQYAHTFKLN